MGMIAMSAVDAPKAFGQTPDSPAPKTPSAPKTLDINDFRVEGVTLLAQTDVETAIYPFVGPGRTTDDVEKARAALEKIYNDKGYQTVAVQIPPQTVRNGVVTLKAVEGKIGHLRVKGSRYFSLDAIKEDAPSLAEGKVPNFKDVQRDIVALNQQSDRRVTPALRAGTTPGTVDVDLTVDDKLPLHASVEYNNRYSASTTQTRINATVHYDNLWQLGHSLSFTYQVAPQRISDAQVYSGSYLARIPGVNWLSVLAYGVKQDSDVSTIGDINVAGRGEIIGTRAVMTLPYEDGFFHTLSIGPDYKHFDEGVTLSGQTVQAPITYYPVTAAYTATWVQDTATTQLDATAVFHLRGLGSEPSDFDAKRFKASGNFVYLRGDLSRTQELPWGLQGFGKLQGQISGSPLISPEELSGGGLDTVRGYLESETLGDSGILGTLELRSPYLPSLIGKQDKTSFIDDWRLYGFVDGGTLSINEPLPNQQSVFNLASVGGGTHIKLFHKFNGSVDVGVPLVSQTSSSAYTARATFRIWVEF
jgi:hemolysin activation/secretion protein